MYILGMVILGFFAVIGICSAFSGLMRSKNILHAELILRGLTADNAEAQLRSAAEICRRHKGLRLRCICSTKDPAYEICRLMQSEYPFIELESCE